MCTACQLSGRTALTIINFPRSFSDRQTSSVPNENDRTRGGFNNEIVDDC